MAAISDPPALASSSRGVVIYRVMDTMEPDTGRKKEHGKGRSVLRVWSFHNGDKQGPSPRVDPMPSFRTPLNRTLAGR